MSFLALVDINKKIITPSSSSNNIRHDQSSSSSFNSNQKMKIPTILKNIGFLCLGYLFCTLNFSLSIILLLLTSSVVLLGYFDDKETVNLIKAKVKASDSKKDDWKENELPPWVKFPDKERAIWLNQVVEQLWPTINNYIIKLLRGAVQREIQKKYERFRFENVDLGCNPPKIDGIKVYNNNSSAPTKDSIIIDFELYYDGNCDVDCSLSGAQVGGIRNFQFGAEMRLVLKPLLLKLPLIGGIQIFFLNTPKLTFSLDGLTSIPGLKYFIRSKIEEQIQKRMVFPNKFSKRFSKAVTPVELKALEPAGVLRVHLVEGRNLMGKDLTGKSDPYCVLSVGADQHRSSIVNQNLNPQWDFWCEFVVGDPLAQRIHFIVYDHDNVNEDDFLGSGVIDISRILRGRTDYWYVLDEAKHGKIHLRFTWLNLTSDLNSLQLACEETKLLKIDSMNSALLITFVDSVQNLPWHKNSATPNPYFTLRVNNGPKQKSKVKRHTLSPDWEQGFLHLIPDPKTDILHLMIIDKHTQANLIHFTYEINDLLTHENMQISKTEIPINENGCNIVISLQLKILVKNSSLYEFLDDDDDDNISVCSTESDTDNNHSLLSKLSRNNSVASIETEEKIEAVLATQSLAAIPFNLNKIREFHLGQIELTLDYSEIRQKFVITVHKISDLPQNDPTDIPDPYVKIKLQPQGYITYRTKKVTDDCNPVFEETFEYLASKSDLDNQVLEIVVKTAKFFSNKTMGQVKICLKNVDLSQPMRKWYELCPKDKH